MNGFMGATEIMLIKRDGGVTLMVIQEHGRTGSEFKGVFRCWRTNETMLNMERYKIGIHNPLHKYKVGDILQDSKKVLVTSSDHKMNISNALLYC